MKHLTDPDSPKVQAIVNKIPKDKLDTLNQKLTDLEQSLLTLDPQMPQHLRESHRILISYPETVHLLDDDEIKNIVKSAQEWTKTTIVKEPAKRSGGSRGKKVSVDDI